MFDSAPGDAHAPGQRLPLAHPDPGSLHLARLTDLWARWRFRPEIAAVALLLLALVAGTYWYRAGVAGARDEAGAQPATATLPRAGSEGSGPAGGTGAPARTPAGADAVVHVAGAVVHPGVYVVAGGSRVADAIQAAGGPAPEADLDRLNLAAKVVDGQRVLVTRRGEPAPPDEVAGTGDPATGMGSGERLNLNTATQAQLEALPGIGPTMAQAILDHRRRRGGFRSVRDLLDVRGIGDARFAELRDLVSV